MSHTRKTHTQDAHNQQTISMRPLQGNFVKDKDNLKELKRPLNNFKAVKIGHTLQQIDKTNCKYLFI